MTAMPAEWLGAVSHRGSAVLGTNAEKREQEALVAALTSRRSAPTARPQFAGIPVDGDIEVVADGYVAVAPLALDLTDNPRLAIWQHDFSDTPTVDEAEQNGEAA